VSGVAVWLGVPGHVHVADGSKRELFRRYAFDVSIRRGDQYVEIDHDKIPVRGRLTFAPTPDALHFVFRVFDSPRGRHVLRTALAGEYRGVSIRFRATEKGEETHRLAPSVVYDTIEAAELDAISFCHRQRPAWAGTYVNAVSVQ
jgi:phage head maturation protease